MENLKPYVNPLNRIKILLFKKILKAGIIVWTTAI